MSSVIAFVRGRHGRSAIRVGLTYLALTIGTVVFILPFVWMISSSLKPVADIFEIPVRIIPRTFRLQNYTEAFHTKPFNLFYLNSTKITVLSIIGSIISCSLAGYAFARLKFWGRNLLFIGLLASMMLPFQVTIIPLFLIFRQVKALNTHWPLILPTFFGTAFFVFLMRQYFLTLPGELEEAAIVEGASYARVFAQIFLPLAKPALVTLAIFEFQNTWNELFNPLVYLNTMSKFTVSLGLAQYSDEMGENWHLMMAGAVTSTVPPIIVFFLFQRYFVEGIALTGLKG
jgi:multiple sugar transport system permease protein